MAFQTTPALYGLGFPAKRLGDLAAASGLQLWQPEAPKADPPNHSVVLLLGHAWENKIKTFWTSPYTAWIEVAALSDQTILDLIRQALNTGLYVSFTTVTANELDLTGEVLEAINQRCPLTQDSHDNIELALHEALSNALLHGNLQMNGLDSLRIDALERFSLDLKGRITNPDLANRRVDVVCAFEDDAVVIDVIDQGAGFVFKQAIEPKASGRGFSLIEASCQSFRLLEGGRRVSMRFPL